MYAGQLVFAQLMDHLPWKTFGRIVERYGGDRRIRELVWQGCVETPCRARHEPPGNAQTPPGGVGPWTWCCGLGNTLEIFYFSCGLCDRSVQLGASTP